MSDKTKIQWTDTTWNPVRGCTKISPGCKHCYAATFAERWRGIPGHPYEQGFDLRLVPEKLTEPLKWKTPRKVFVNSMSDLFQDGVPDEYIDRVFAVMAETPRHTYQVLTKRPDRMLNWFMRVALVGASDALFDKAKGLWPLKNVWLGVSVENQEWADKRIPLLLNTPAAVRFVSYEPAIGVVDFSRYLIPSYPSLGSMGGGSSMETQLQKAWESKYSGKTGLDWVIVGGESGPGARSFNIQWARDVIKQCRAAGVACFVKQMGSVPIVAACRQNHYEWGDGNFKYFGKDTDGLWRINLKDRKGGSIEEWTEDLRVRQMPGVHQ